MMENLMIFVLGFEYEMTVVEEKEEIISENVLKISVMKNHKSSRNGNYKILQKTFFMKYY